MSFNNDLCIVSNFTSLIDLHSSSATVNVGGGGTHEVTQENTINTSSTRDILLTDTVSANNSNLSGTTEHSVPANNRPTNTNNLSFSIGNISVKTANVNSMFKADNIHKKHIWDIFNPSRANISLILKTSYLRNILSRADIIILTDTRLSKHDIRDLKSQTKGQYTVYSTTSSKTTGGVTILIATSIQHRISFKKFYYSPNSPERGRAAFLSIILEDNSRLNIGAGYPSPTNLHHGLTEILRFFDTCLSANKSSFSIIAGDFNTAMDTRKDNQACNMLDDFLFLHKLSDTYRVRYKNKNKYKGFTFKGNENSSPSRIDYIFTTPP